MAVTDLRVNRPTSELTAPIGYSDAFLVAVQMMDVPEHELWLNSRPIAVEPFSAGATCIYDLKQDPRAFVAKPSHSVHFLMPRSTLTGLSETAGGGEIADLVYRPGIGQIDPTMRLLAEAVISALATQEDVSRLFLDHLLSAACVHAVERYGSANPVVRKAIGGLAPWQNRLVKELIDANPGGDLAMLDLANACRLSVSQFMRAFRQTNGVSPHKWLTKRRLDRARALMTGTRLSLAEVSAACGFFDQSHFAKAFSRAFGTTPSKWRRENAPARKSG